MKQTSSLLISLGLSSVMSGCSQNDGADGSPVESASSSNKLWPGRRPTSEHPDDHGIVHPAHDWHALDNRRPGQRRLG